MSVQEMKERVSNLLDEYEDWDLYELRRVFSEVIREREMSLGWSEDARGNAWTDEELRVILADAPTKENCLKHARAFQRGYGAIEQIFRWAATTDATVRKKRPNDAFVQQIKRVAKQLGWRA